MAHPQLASNVAYFRKPPRDYRIGAVLSAVLCFFPLGLIAIHYSLQVQRQFRSGNLEDSMKASNRTKFLIQTSVIIGSLLWFGGLLGIIYIANK
ncbi:hypothetical protein KUTeg_019555 [Tegillarca granosa]|uniref:Uncharacterized protein n=1 Tax=Tegillarca granosa TaxID=220873 RepID=A0ABQ9ECW5_TEGGR|nr:hypothetical protein KUTeg_019555 [Tegillarca granosa]